MFVAGIDAHVTYVVVAIVSNDGVLVQKPLRIRNGESRRLVELLEAHHPLEVVVEASPAWPWLYDLLAGPRCRFVLAHPKKLRVIAEANYKNDALDATLTSVTCLPRAEQTRRPTLAALGRENLHTTTLRRPAFCRVNRGKREDVPRGPATYWSRTSLYQWVLEPLLEDRWNQRVASVAIGYAATASLPTRRPVASPTGP